MRESVITFAPPRYRRGFDLQRWQAANEAVREQWRQVRSPAELAACEAADRRLLGEIVEALARLPLDLPTRRLAQPLLVQLQQAARIATGGQ